MKPTHIATIMLRHYISEGNFIYNLSHTVLGTIDEKNQIFKDSNDNEYLPITDKSILTSEIPYGYYNIISIDNIKETLGSEMTLAEAIKEYEKQWQKYFYFVGRTKSGEIITFMFDLNRLKNEDSDEPISMPELKIQVIEESPFLQDQQGMNPDIAALIMELKDDIYTSEELKKIQKNLEDIKSDIEHTQEIITEKMFPGLAAQAAKTSKKEEQSKTKVPEEKMLSINDVFSKVTKTLIAQDEPARRVITEIVRKELDPRKKKEAILLTGSTGVGKTELMRLIAKYLDKPFLKVDATQLTIPGYTGTDIEEVLWRLYESCGKNKEKAESAIIFFDEIDKKGSDRKDDVSGQGVLNLLLSFITGTEYMATASTKHPSEIVRIDTSNMTVILGGAFTDVYKKYNTQISGFTREDPKEKKSPTMQDFVDKGMMTDEFMGRTSIVKMNELDVDAIKRIMLESDESAVLIQQQIFDKLNVKLTYTDGYIDALAKAAYEKKTGARGLNTEVDNTTWCCFDEVYSNPGVYKEAILTEKTVENPKEYQLVKKVQNHFSKYKH